MIMQNKSLSRVVEGRGPMKPGSLIIQGANSRGFPKDEAYLQRQRPLLRKRFFFGKTKNALFKRMRS